MRLRVWLLLLPLVVSFAPPSALAASDPTLVSRWVEADFDLAQPTLYRVDVTGTLLVHKYRFNGHTYSARELGDTYRDAQAFGRGDQFVGEMESAVRTGLGATLAQIFPKATRTVDDVEVDLASLSAPRADAYDPPVRIAIAATVLRSPAEMGLDAFSPSALEAAFAAGGVVTTDIPFTADAGYLARFTLHAPASPARLVFADAAGGDLSADGRSVVVSIDAQRSTRDLNSVLTVGVLDADAVAPRSEEVRTVVDVSFGELVPGGRAVPVRANVRGEVESLSVANRFADALPSSLHLDFVSADAIRALRASGAITAAHLEAAKDTILGAVQDDLESALGSGARSSATFDEASLTSGATPPFDTSPPVVFLAEVSALYPIPHAEDAQTALDIGAALRMDLRLAAPTRETTYIIHPPPGLAFAEAHGATLSQDRLSATVTLSPGEQVPILALSVRDADAPAYTSEDAALAITIDLADIDVSLGRAAGGDFGELSVDVEVDGALRVIRVPPDMARALGSNVELPYVSSDAIRIAYERGLITDAQLDEMEAELLDTVASGLSAAMGRSIEVTGGFDRTSLSPAFISDPPTHQDPITFHASASFTKALSGGAAPAREAVALYSVPQSFAFRKVRDLDTTYTIILPRGLAVANLKADGGEASAGKSPDGREQFSVTPEDSTARTTMSIAITPTFVLAKFWPVVLAAGIFVTLLVGTPIAIVVLRRRGRAKRAK